MRKILMVAIGEKNQIGLNNALPWHLPKDLANFKKRTMGKTLIMGRKTYESIGRPLPGRVTIVVSRTRSCDEKYPEVLWAKDLNEAYGLVKTEDVCIVGGRTIYEQALNDIDDLYLTKVDYSGEADTFFPSLNLDSWQLVEEEKVEDRINWVFFHYKK